MVRQGEKVKRVGGAWCYIASTAVAYICTGSWQVNNLAPIGQHNAGL